MNGYHRQMRDLRVKDDETRRSRWGASHAMFRSVGIRLGFRITQTWIHIWWETNVGKLLCRWFNGWYFTSHSVSPVEPPILTNLRPCWWVDWGRNWCLKARLGTWLNVYYTNTSSWIRLQRRSAMECFSHTEEEGEDSSWRPYAHLLPVLKSLQDTSLH